MRVVVRGSRGSRGFSRYPSFKLRFGSIKVDLPYVCLCLIANKILIDLRHNIIIQKTLKLVISTMSSKNGSRYM